MSRNIKSSTTEKMKAVLVDLKLIDTNEQIVIVRLHPGHLQRSEGAWSFAIESENRVERGGSQWSCREVIQRHRSGGKISVQHHEWGTFSLYLFKGDSSGQKEG